MGLLLLFGYQIFKALRYAAMNRILQRKVYLDEATGLPNKNKCEELLDAPNPPDGNTALCVFDLNNLRTINNNLGHDKGDEYIRAFAEQLTSSSLSSTAWTGTAHRMCCAASGRRRQSIPASTPRCP